MKRSSLDLVLIFAGLIFLARAEASAQEGYGPWRTTHCYQGIDFRVKIEPRPVNGKYKWIVDFRNRYQEEVAFSATATESYIASAKTDMRFIIGPGKTDGTYWFLAETKEINVYVDKLVNHTTKAGEYVPCGN